MSTFALDASSSPSDIISGLNYALANLDTNNPAFLGNVLTANTATGEITTTSTNSSGYTSTTIVSYLYQYMNVKYANSATGGSGFTSNATLSNFYGLHNTSSTSISNNPVDYNWFRVTGGFGTTKGLYYQTIGGRQVLFFPNVSPPSTSFVAVQDNTPIDLDTVTAAQNNQIVYISAYYQGNTTPATPAGGFYNFNTLTFTAPFDWSGTIPGFTANTNIYISQNVFSGNSQSNVAPSTTWTTPVIFTSQTSGNTGATGPRGFVPLGFVVVPSDPTTYTTAQLSTAFSSSRSNTNPPIGLGFAPIANDTAQFFYSNSLNVSDTVTLVKQYDGSVWSDVEAQVVSGDLIYPGTITANQISVNSVYALNIQSTDAQLGNVTSAGFWLASNTGSARFAGNISIGNNLSVGANATIGTGLTIGGLTTNGVLNANTVGTTQITASSITTGKIAANSITGNMIVAQTIFGNAIIANTLSGNTIQANTITANTIQGNSIVAGSITATQLQANLLTVGNIVSFGSTINSPTGTGYWLNFTSGNVYFGGNTQIGTNLIVGNNAVIGGFATIGANVNIGGNLRVTGLVTGGNLDANTVVTTTIVPQSVSQGNGISSSTSLVISPPVANRIYPYTFANTRITISSTGSTVYVSGTLDTRTAFNFGGVGTGTLTFYLLKDGVSLTSQPFQYTVPSSGIQGDNITPFAFIDTAGFTVGTTYTYTMAVSAVGSGALTSSQISMLGGTLFCQILKR